VNALFSIFFWLFFALACVPLFFGALILRIVTFPFDRNGFVLHQYTCFWGMLYVYVNPYWFVRVTGQEHLPWRGPAVIVANHASIADIIAVFGMYRPFKWVSKASMFKVPFLGWNMWLNRYVPLVRGDKESIAKMMVKCGEWIDRGVPMLFFPEGTRSEDGSVKAFKDGAFKLAVDKNIAIIPVALAGTSEVIPKHGWVLRERAHCRVRVLPPMHPRDFGNDYEKLRDEARARIIAAKAELDASSRKT